MTPNLYAMLASNGPQTTTAAQYLDVTPVATGTTASGSSTTLLTVAGVLIALFFLFGGHHR